MAKDRYGKQVESRPPVDGRRVVAAAGTALQLSTTVGVVDTVIITAETNNTGAIVVGASTAVEAVATRRGTPLNPGESLTLGAVDLREIYLDAGITGDGVTFLYFA